MEPIKQNGMHEVDIRYRIIDYNKLLPELTASMTKYQRQDLRLWCGNMFMTRPPIDYAEVCLSKISHVARLHNLSGITLHDVETFTQYPVEELRERGLHGMRTKTTGGHNTLSLYTERAYALEDESRGYDKRWQDSWFEVDENTQLN